MAKESYESSLRKFELTDEERARCARMARVMFESPPSRKVAGGYVFGGVVASLLAGVELDEVVAAVHREWFWAIALMKGEAAILDALPYRYDDGTDDEADPGECIGYAAKELAELRTQVAAAFSRETVIATSTSVEAQLRQERDEARAKTGLHSRCEICGDWGAPYLAPDGGSHRRSCGPCAVLRLGERVVIYERERDEAKAEVARLREALAKISLDEYESTSSASQKVHGHARIARNALYGASTIDTEEK